MTPAGRTGSASSSELRTEGACPDSGTAAAAQPPHAAEANPTPVVRAGDTPPPRISIVIPAFNESRRIADSLGKLREFLGRTPLSFEILVVDDGSTDGTADDRQAFRTRRRPAHPP